MIVETPFDTIAAISTPPGEGGIGIVRLSGDEAIPIVKKIFVPHRKKSETLRETTFKMHLGYIKNGERIIDEVLVSVMRAPHTYTREDIVEINCHGGAIAVNEVLRLVLEHGARLAQPGEFTKRAFINGRIDLAQAEAVLDIVRAKTARALEAAVGQLTGSLSESLLELIKGLKDILVQLEANIDFPEEEDIAPIRYDELEKQIIGVSTTINELLKSYDTGRILRNGILTVIAGKPNVGKSSLLNAFLKFDRAIVTPLPGTTRDVIEEQLNIDGIPFILADTAGITETEDIIEKEGVKKSRYYLQRAQLVILVFDGSESLDERDRILTGQTKHLPRIPVVNKSDLPIKINLAELSRLTGTADNLIIISAKTGKGLKELEKKMADKVISGDAEGDHSILVTSARHFNILKRALLELSQALDTIRARGGAELIAFDVRSAMDTLGEITGKVTNREILDEIFQNFCIGK
ncbi:MAG: tRNA uridine-5-carboxymethylaminomethyl(34) synthesis GTPase MnmE [Spirochaetota bacterium]